MKFFIILCVVFVTASARRSRLTEDLHKHKRSNLTLPLNSARSEHCKNVERKIELLIEVQAKVLKTLTLLSRKSNSHKHNETPLPLPPSSIESIQLPSIETILPSSIETIQPPRVEAILPPRVEAIPQPITERIITATVIDSQSGVQKVPAEAYQHGSASSNDASIAGNKPNIEGETALNKEKIEPAAGSDSISSSASSANSTSLADSASNASVADIINDNHAAKSGSLPNESDKASEDDPKEAALKKMVDHNEK